MGKKERKFSGLSRRQFLQRLGGGLTGIAVFGPLIKLPLYSVVAEEVQLPAAYRRRVHLRVNGRDYWLELPNRTTLLEALRDYLGLTGTKEGCNRGQCGACTVLMDGRAVYACSQLAVLAEDTEITTIEGLEAGGQLDPIQQSFLQQDAMQCGFCIPGQIMAARALLNHTPRPDLKTIRTGLAGNLCRCGAYYRIWQAVQKASEAHDG